MIKRLWILFVVLAVPLASLACSVSIDTGVWAPVPLDARGAHILLVIAIVYTTGVIGGVSTLRKGQHMVNSKSKVYETVTAALLVVGMSLILLAIVWNMIWLLWLGCGMIVASCPWGVLGALLLDW